MTVDERLKTLWQCESDIRLADEDIQRLHGEIAKTEAKIQSRIRERDEYILRRDVILEAINGVENGLYRNLLRFYYVDKMTWEQVASKMNYTPIYIFKLRKLALSAVEEKLSKEE